jgi:hypothetical protein
MSLGYGPDGTSVQNSVLGDVLCSDRELMQRTLLRGEPVIYGFRVVDSTAQKKKKTDGSGAYQRVSLKLAHWKAVMQAGLALYRIGKYSSGTDCTERKGQPRVYLEIPPEGDTELTKQFHNRLMMLCQMSFVQLSDSIIKRSSQATKSTPPVNNIVQAAGEPTDSAQRACVADRQASAPPPSQKRPRTAQATTQQMRPHTEHSRRFTWGSASSSKAALRRPVDLEGDDDDDVLLQEEENEAKEGGEEIQARELGQGSVRSSRLGSDGC